MTAPDLVAACVMHLRAHQTVTGLIAVDADGDPLIVQDEAPARSEFAEGLAIVVSHAGTESAGVRGGTFEATRLQLEFWADPRRDDDDNVEAPSEPRARMVAAYRAVDRIMHRPQGGTQDWGGVTTIDCERRAGINPYQVPGTGGLWRGTALYAVGDA